MVSIFFATSQDNCSSVGKANLAGMLHCSMELRTNCCFELCYCLDKYTGGVLATHAWQRCSRSKLMPMSMQLPRWPQPYTPTALQRSLGPAEVYGGRHPPPQFCSCNQWSPKRFLKGFLSLNINDVYGTFNGWLDVEFLPKINSKDTFPVEIWGNHDRCTRRARSLSCLFSKLSMLRMASSYSSSSIVKCAQFIP
ncbi:uncharacterized protein LOC129749222 [Uranotaenia lowii]|uniref:uncharacterized protein LOC129749222 n=1 Tax=Uranotaenia lowii TaxID=190385 RepID=UPI002479FAB8|nr:uncharacterized protein LOC129749222 [Uranotaenia lowii]